MNTTITITPESNVINNKVIDEDKIKQQTFAARGGFHLFENIKSGEQRKDSLLNVSLYDDFIIINGEKNHILNMLSK